MKAAVNVISARRRCNVVQKLGHCLQWGRQFGISWQRVQTLFTFIPCDDCRLQNPASFSKSITLRF